VRSDHPVARNLVGILPPMLYIQASDELRASWLAALQEPQIGQALTLIHRDPTRPWTVASLAHELAMSRSAFAARFTQLVDQPAMQYLTRWRMQLAERALQTEGATVAELAARLGYQSEAAFARAFKRVTGLPPGAVRRGGQPQPAAPLVAAAS
jgi:AraC-like DNA-binding protein